VKSILGTGLWLAAVVTLAGCATMRPIPPAQLQLPIEPPIVAGAESGDIYAPAEDASAPDVEAAPRSVPGTGEFINRSLASRAPDPKAPAGDVSFNFEGESLHAVIKAILGDVLQENYVIAPGVQGNVTFSTAKPLRADQALSILEMLLRWNNATLVWENGRYTILPIAQAVQGNLTPRTGPVANARGYEVRAVPLQFISAAEMEKVLKPYAKPEAMINIDMARNMIVLGGTRAELQNYLQTIEIFDVDWLSGMSVGVFSLQQAEAAKVVGELEKIFGEGSNTPLAGMFRFIPLEGVNGVLVITPQPKYLATIEQWLERFDLGTGEAGQRLYVYDVKNVKAVDLAATLSEVFGGGGGGASAARPGGAIAPGLEPIEIRSVSGASSRVGEPLQQQPQQRAEARAAATGANVQGGGDGAATGAGAAGGVVDGAGGIALGAIEEVRISAVEENNALLIRATSGQWESIRRVIERLDQIPLQVVIEAHILKVNLSDQLQYGLRWFFEDAIGVGENGLPASARDRARARAGSDWTGSGWSDIAGTIGGGGSSWSFIGPNAGAIITMLDSVTDLQVLSAPSLVVLNNKQASINSGVQVPIQTNNISLPGTGGQGQAYQTSQYLQTGITLNVTPRVNPGGLVFLEIDQEDSDAGEPVDGGNPPISSSTITTEVAVQSGQTVLLGGLIKQTDSEGTSGFPFLSRIPVVGALFGSKTLGSNRQELLVMITPRVIRDPTEAKRITEEYKTRFRGLQPLLPVVVEPVPVIEIQELPE